MTEKTKKNIHYIVICTLFTILTISAVGNIWCTELEYTEIAKIWHYVGLITEIPFLILCLVYMYKYFKFKKGEKKK